MTTIPNDSSDCSGRSSICKLCNFTSSTMEHRSVLTSVIYSIMTYTWICPQMGYTQNALANIFPMNWSFWEICVLDIPWYTQHIHCSLVKYAYYLCQWLPIFDGHVGWLESTIFRADVPWQSQPHLALAACEQWSAPCGSTDVGNFSGLSRETDHTITN